MNNKQKLINKIYKLNKKYKIDNINLNKTINLLTNNVKDFKTLSNINLLINDIINK